MSQINYAVVSAFERSKEIDEKHVSTRSFTMLLMAVFFVILMVGLAGGATMYSKITDTQVRNNGTYLLSGLIANTVHANDTLFSLAEGEGPEGPALVMVKAGDDATYETRLYLYKGHVMEEYAAPGAPYNPSTATVLFDSGTFDFSFSGKLLTITTDDGTCDVALRSRQGGGL